MINATNLVVVEDATNLLVENATNLAVFVENAKCYQSCCGGRCYQ